MRVRLVNVRGTYLYLNTKQVPNAEILRDNPNAKAKHSSTLILDANSKVIALPPDPKAKPITMDDVLVVVANENWKDKGPAFLASLEGKRKCYRTGNSMLTKAGEIANGFEGNMYVVAKSDDQPKIYGRGGTAEDLITDPAEIGRLFKWGCYYDAVIDVYATSKGSKGIFAALQKVQYRRKGEALGVGIQDLPDDLATIEGEDDGDDLL